MTVHASPRFVSVTAAQRREMQTSLRRESDAFFSRPSAHNFRPPKTTMDQLRHRGRRRRWRHILRSMADEWLGTPARDTG
jgi:hypothetical protein